MKKQTATKPSKETEKPAFIEHALLGEIQPGKDDSNLIKVRVITGPQGPCLDVRQHLKTERYTGYTAKGVSIPLDQVEELWDMLHDGDGTLRNLAKMIPAARAGKAAKK